MTHPVAFLFDVDNTLLDNDRVQQDLGHHIEREFGRASRDEYWKIFEELRTELGYAEIAGHNVTTTRAVRPPMTPSKVDADKVPTGKANLIRAAFKAGLKPAAIAREFGISQSVVRGVLASLKDHR